MPSITEIKPQVRRPDRVSIYLDEEFWIGLSATAVLNLGLYKGMELDEEQLQEMEQAVGLEEAFYYVCNLLAGRPLSSGMISDKLRKREYGDPVIALCLERLVDLQMVDDEDYARQLASNKRENGQGKGKVRQYMTTRAKLNRDLVDRVLEEVYDDPEEDLRLATEVLITRYGEGLLPVADQRRALAMLIRRGFESGTARSAVDSRSMSQAEQEEAEDPSAARELVQRRYGDLSDPANQRKAWAYLSRRGYTSATIKRALLSPGGR